MARTSPEADDKRRKHPYSYRVARSRSNPRVMNNVKCIDGYDDEFKNLDLIDNTTRFKRGDFVVSCWYRSSPLSRPIQMNDWREATVLAVHADATFSVQFFNGEIENNVPKSCLSLNLDVESLKSLVDDNSRDNDNKMKQNCHHINYRTDHQSEGINAKLNNDNRLDDWKRLLGEPKLREVCEVFDAYVLPAASGESRRIRSSDAVKALLELGCKADRFSLKTQLSEMGISPKDTVEVHEFLRAFYCMVPSETLSETYDRPGEESCTRQPSNNDMGPYLNSPSVMTTLLPVSKLAASIFSEHRWVGTCSQTDAFQRRMCVGRPPRVQAALHHARSVFDELCHDSNEGEIALSDVKRWLMKVYEDDLMSLESVLAGFMKSCNGSTVSYPEILAGFGFMLERTATCLLTVSSAFSILRSNCFPPDALSVGRTVLRYIENIISAPHDIHLRRVSTGSKVYQTQVASHVGGSELLYAAGFRLNVEVSDPLVAMRSKEGYIYLLGAPKTGAIPDEVMNSLNRVRNEIEEEIFTLEGAPSITTAIRVMRKEDPSERVSTAQSAIKLALRYVTNILDSPYNPRPRRIKISNRVFHRIIGQFEGGRELMEALGFSAIENGTIYELHSMSRSPMYASRSFCTIKLSKFPALDPATIDFLLRRMTDLKTAHASLMSISTKRSSAQALTPDSGLTCTRVAYTEPTKMVPAANGISTSQQHTRNPRKSFLPKHEKRVKDKIPTSTESPTKSVSCTPSPKHNTQCLKSKTNDDMKQHNKTTTIAEFVLMEGSGGLQKLQLSLMRRAFNRLDALNEGRITCAGLRRSFRLMGKDSSYHTVQKWIQERDIDQDSCVNFDEFVLSLSTLLPVDDSNCTDDNIEYVGQLKERRRPISTAFGYMRLHNSLPRCCEATNYVLNHINSTLASPSDSSLWRIPLNGPDFDSKVGSLIGGKSLFEAVGWCDIKKDHSMLVLGSSTGEWVSVPKEVLRELEMVKGQILSHLRGLDYPEVFNIGTVAMAVAEAERIGSPVAKHVQCIDMVSEYIGNILKDSFNPYCRKINTRNALFVEKVASVPGGIELLVAAGFRENANGALVFPKDGNLEELDARKVELDAGLSMLKARVVANQSAAVTLGVAKEEDDHCTAEIIPSNVNSPAKLGHRPLSKSTKKVDTYLIRPHKKTAAISEVTKYSRKIPSDSDFQHPEEMGKSMALKVKIRKRTRRTELCTVTTTLSAFSPLHSTQLRVKQLEKICRPGNTVKVGGGSDHAEEGIIIAVEHGSNPILDLEQELSHRHEAGETVEIFQLQQGAEDVSFKIWQCKSILNSIVSLAAEKGEKLRATYRSQIEFEYRPVNKYVYVSEQVLQIPAEKSNGCGFGVFPQLGRLIALGHKGTDLLVWDEGLTLGDLQRLCIEQSSGDLGCIS